MEFHERLEEHEMGGQPAVMKSPTILGRPQDDTGVDGLVVDSNLTDEQHVCLDINFTGKQQEDWHVHACHTFEEALQGRIPDHWAVPVQESGLLAIMLKPWILMEASSETDPDDKTWRGPSFVQLSMQANVYMQADVEYYGAPRKMLLLKSKDTGDEVPSARIHRLEEEFSNLLYRGRPDSGPWIWPLYTQKDIFAIAKQSPLRTKPFDCKLLAAWVFCWHWKENVWPLFNVMRDEISPCCAYACAYNFFYVRMLWILAFMCILVEIVGHDNAGGPAPRMVWEVFKVGVVAWGALLFWRSRKRSQMFDPSSTGDMMDKACESFDPVPYWEGKARSLLGWLITFIVSFVNACILFAYVQFNTWLIFSWGDCVERKCNDPQLVHGFWGWLAEVLVDILNAAIWAGLLELAKGVGALIASARRHRWREDYICSVMTHTMVLEAVAKVAPFMFLALFFVPKWAPSAAEGNSKCEGGAFIEVLDPQYIFCIARRIDDDQRRHHFKRLFKGPFTVAPFIAILIKVIVPMVAIALNIFARNCRCKSKCFDRFSDGLMRLIGLIFTYDNDHVGCFSFLLRGWPFSNIKIVNTPLPTNEGNKIVPEVQDNTLARRCMIAGLAQGARKPFETVDELLEVNLNFLFVLFFAPILPMGVLFTLGARLLESNTDLTKMLFVRRRTLPHGTLLAQAMHNKFCGVAVVCGAVWSIILSTVTYGEGFTWSSVDGASHFN